MFDDWLTAQLKDLRDDNLYRQLHALEGPTGTRVKIAGSEKLVFCSNNYLGLANHPAVVQAVKDGAGTWGWGAGGSRLICGNMTPHEHLQERLAQMLGKEACLTLTSGYMTNHALLSTIPQKGDLIMIDKLVHASLIDGARASGAQVRVWPHGQTDKLRRYLERGGYRRAFIVTDSLFSMDGDFAPLQELVELKRRHEAVLMLDEAHTFACTGPEGLGWAAEAGLLDDVDIFVATLSKALGGAGAFVAGSKVMIEYLINRARPFIFTTATPAVNCLAAGAALDIVAAEPQRRQRLWDNSRYFRERCQQMQLDIGPSESYIVPIIIGSAAKAAAATQQLSEHGFLVPAIRPPTVKRGTSRLRISLMSEHTRDDIDRLCQALDSLMCPTSR